MGMVHGGPVFIMFDLLMMKVEVIFGAENMDQGMDVEPLIPAVFNLLQ